MIMKVRLEAIHKYRKTKYKNAKAVVSRYNLAKRYFEFFGKAHKNRIRCREKATCI